MSDEVGTEVESWQRPPFEKGNQAARRHGAYARIADDELSGKEAEVYEALADDAPVREGDALPAHDTLAVKLLAETLCRIDLISAEVEENGWGGRGRGSLFEYDARLRSTVIELIREMGMTPASRAKLGVDILRAAGSARVMSFVEYTSLEEEVAEEKEKGRVDPYKAHLLETAEIRHRDGGAIPARLLLGDAS